MAFALCAPLGLHAQDLRHVAEPKIPRSCAVLTARLTSQGTTLSDSDEGKLDTSRIQQAMDHCRQGQAVELKSDGDHDAFLTASLELRRGVTLLVDKGVVLFGSRDPRAYDLHPGVCGTITEFPHAGCKPLISGNGVANAGIMGDGIIDGRGGAKMLGQQITWWDLAAKAKPHALQNNPRLISLENCDNFTLYRIQLRNSPNFHVSYSGGNGFTVWGIIINVPGEAKNTDGIDIGQPWPEAHRPTTNATVVYSYIHAGDDIVAAKSPFGYLTSHITVAHDHFYTGHGISIGSATSGGITALRVSDITIDGAGNAFHIKSNIKLGGLVHDIEFDDICVRNSRNPIFIETHYDSSGHEVDGATPDKLPHFTDIRFNDMLVQGGGKIMLDGLDATHRMDASFHNVFLDDPAKFNVVTDHASIQLDGSNLPIKGEDVTVSAKPSSATPKSCDARFVPFPAPISKVR